MARLSYGTERTELLEGERNKKEKNGQQRLAGRFFVLKSCRALRLAQKERWVATVGRYLVAVLIPSLIPASRVRCMLCGLFRVGLVECTGYRPLAI